MKCKRCGECCKSNTLLKKCTEKEISFIKKIYKDLGKDINNTKCKHLYYITGWAACNIYKDRPGFCKDYYCNKAGASNINGEQR